MSNHFRLESDFNMKYLLFFIIAFRITQALGKPDGFHAYAAMGITYTPSSLRAGFHDWELGILNQVFGFDKIFDINKNSYSGFGFVVTHAGQPGVFASMGWHGDLWFIPMRSELAAYMDFHGNSYATGLIGLSYGF